MKTVHAMSVHSATGHNLYHIELTCCEITKFQFEHTLIYVKSYEKKLFIGLNMQQLHHLGCDWTANG